MTFPPSRRVSFLPGICAALLSFSTATAAETTDQLLLEEQRRVFRDVYAEAELGNWRPATKQETLLRHYPLWPDLRAAWLRTRLRHKDYTGVDAFLKQFPTLKPVRELRYRYALSLGNSGRLAQYLTLYQQFYQGLELARLDCLALQAELAAGREARIVNRGIERWMTGRNQVVECDPVFAHLQQSGHIGPSQYRQRFDLAIAARQFPIARYLATSLDEHDRTRARQWSDAANDAAGFLKRHAAAGDSVDRRQQLLYAVERVAYRKPLAAASVWNEIASQYEFSAIERGAISRYIALWAARHRAAESVAMLNALPPETVDTEVRRWRVRASLIERNWPAVLISIKDLPEAERQEEEWRYWHARAVLQTGQPELAQPLFGKLAAERSYYGFLAADQVGQRYAFADNRLSADEVVIEELAGRAAMIRARELFLVGLDGRGRSEWDAAVALLSREEKLQASLLAHRWGWHSRAIATAAAAGHLDDLELRYPMPYRRTFENYADKTRLSRTWVLGIARSESLFMRDIRSVAGAIGLMQLMPETGRRTAKEFQLPYAGLVTLTDPEGNIRLGTAYLEKMLRRFNDHRVLATAAYNAGPLNVENWLPVSSDIDTLVWIENIPFNETRKYVRRVFMTDTIFHWRLTGETKRLSAEMTSVVAPANPPQLATSR